MEKKEVGLQGMTKVEAATCEIVINRALDETWRSERRGNHYVVFRGTKALKTPQEVGDYIEDIWDQKAAEQADRAYADASDMGAL